MSAVRSPAPVRAGLLAALVFAAIAFVGAPASHAQTPAAVNPCPLDKGYAVVKLQNTAYNPPTTPLPTAGGSVCFEHDDGNLPHSVTFLPPTRGDIDSNPDCSPSNTAACFHQGDAPFIVQLTTNGVYQYHCKIHESMKGTITVGNGVAPPTTTTTAAGGTTTTKPPNNTPTTVGSISTASSTTVVSTTTSINTTTTLPLTTQTTSSALAKPSSNNNDEPSAALKAIGIVLLAAVVAALIPSWRRLT